MSSEYSYWQDFFKSEKFKKHLNSLKRKLKNKKVVFYCNGIYFDALSDLYNLSEYFSVVGVSDIRYEQNCESDYKGYRCIKPSELRQTGADCVIISSPNPDFIKEYLQKNNLVKSVILPLYKPQQNLFFRTVLALEYFKVTKNLYKSIKYCLFCTEEELQTKINYENVLQGIKKKVKSGGKLRVVFVCEENQKWGYQFVYELMKKDSVFEVLPVVLYPIISKNRVEFTQEKNKEFFTKQGVESVDGYDYERETTIDLKTFAPDIVFYQQPWYLEGANHPVNLSKYALTVMIPYGYTTLSEKSWGSDAVRRVYSNLWMFFSESKYHNKFYEKTAGMRHKDNLLATGTPKLDYYIIPVKQEFEDLWKGGENRIIWAPHHSINNTGLCMSTFEEYYKFFLDFAKNHKEYSFVVKPHPALRSTCAAQQFMTEEEYDTYMEEWNNLPNASVYTEGNYFDIFKTSDILVTDCSSFFAEYFPTGKPIILLDQKNRAPFDKFGKQLEKGFYKVNKPGELPKLLTNLLVNKNDPKKELRLKIYKKEFPFRKQLVSYCIIRYLDGLLKKQVW